MIRQFQGHLPQIHPDAWIATSADVIGRVELDKDVSIWPQVVLRGDIEAIIIGEGSNVQDGSVLHVADDLPTQIGKYVTIGHGAIVHACKIGDHCLIGMGATILDGTVIGDHVIIGAGSLIPMNKTIPDGVMVYGNPAKVIRELTEEEKAWLTRHAKKYIQLSKVYQTEDTNERS